MAFNGITPASPEAIVERLLKEALVRGNCLICIRVKDKKGYARVGCYSPWETVVLAHRLVYQVKYGPIPKDKPLILHTCDNPSCINPEHLYAGTAAQNTADMLRKRRGANGSHKGYGSTYVSVYSRD